MSTIIGSETVSRALRAAGWTPLPRWATPEERAKCDVTIFDLPRSHEIHVLAGPGGSGTLDDILTDLEEAGIPAVRRGTLAVVNSKGQA